ncbi:MAG: hypothetical protein RL733_956 [Actinomycetota bacterium]|jgi:uncharacterized membrane protein
MAKSARVIAVVALIAALFSFVKFNHCRGTNWISPDVYVHMCYSDISALYGAREINTDKWPYSSATNAVEYPVLTGVVMWATGLLVDDPSGYRTYFDINTLLILLLFFASIFILWRLKPDYVALFPIAPAVFGSLLINWDVYAVLFALLSLYFYKDNKMDLSALFMGVAIATKFYPGVILFGIALIFWKNKEIQKLIRYLAITVASWLAINLPIATNSFDGWWRFFKLNIERDNDLGSLWYAAALLDLPTGNLNNLTIIAFLLALGAIGVLYFSIADHRSDFESLVLIAFLTVAAFVTISKVYSPQYILWLTPLAVLAMTVDEERKAFWVWQGTEALYHFAIWQYLASYTGAKFGIPETFYALTIFIRVAGLAYFSGVLIRTAKPRSQGNLLEFLPDSTHG